ncbi:MAG: putative sugar O-methyltransferase [Verrucomicrobia bacterium]|nr:putative sugar O-methyltransferase [Verrucomicrobiota bacterium]
MVKVDGRIRLADQRPITAQEFERARSVCERIRRLVASRADSIAKGRLDPTIALPGNNWSPDADQPFLNRYRQIVQCRFEIIQNLRLYAQFSGYDLATQAIVTHGRQVPEVLETFDQEIERLAPNPDDWVERYRAITRHIPADIIPSYPVVMGEIGWRVGGKPVNHDVYAYQERTNLLFESGVIECLRSRARRTGRVTVLEIGGGYGGLAHALFEIIPNRINYFVCDLPESILSSAIYLGIIHPEVDQNIYEGTNLETLKPPACPAITFVPNYLLDDLLALNPQVDLAINTLSFPEMTEAQVRYYGERLRRLLDKTGMLFEQNEDGRWMGLLDCKSILSEYLPHRATVRSKTVPVLSKGEADLWSNSPLTEIIPDSCLPFRKATQRLCLWFWRMLWLARVPSWALIRIRQWLHKNVSPETFLRIKKCWNRVGGRMPS